MALGSRHAPIVGSAFEVADDRRPILERLILGTPQDQLMAEVDPIGWTGIGVT